LRVYFDTSVLVAGLVECHPDHARAMAWIDRVDRKEVRGVISLHGVAETWSVLTSLPLRPAIQGSTALRLVREGLLARFEVAEADRRDYERVLEAAADREVRGGAVYDALHAAMARKARAEEILTLDLRDFRRVAPDYGSRVRAP